MKKIITFLSVSMAVMLSLTSCMSTQGVSSSRTIVLPESTAAAAKRISEYERNDQYRYSFTATNWGDALCEVKIYDDKYMRVYYPQTDTAIYYYYKFYGDYLDSSLSNDRLGIFGYAVGITAAEVDEIVFRNPIHGGYKFKSRADQMRNDKKYQSGCITWNTFPEARQRDNEYFLEFFERQDRKLTSKTDEVGNKKDIARRLYCAISEKTGFSVTWDEEPEEPQAESVPETASGNQAE